MAKSSIPSSKQYSDVVIGITLRELRRRIGFKAITFKDKYDVNPKLISAIENGRSGIKATELFWLLDIYLVNLSEFHKLCDLIQANPKINVSIALDNIRRNERNVARLAALETKLIELVEEHTG